MGVGDSAMCLLTESDPYEFVDNMFRLSILSLRRFLSGLCYHGNHYDFNGGIVFSKVSCPAIAFPDAFASAS
jgi:hypothetical protein